eukprot:3765683-Pyramimonas_sp.AAC.1
MGHVRIKRHVSALLSEWSRPEDQTSQVSDHSGSWPSSSSSATRPRSTAPCYSRPCAEIIFE